MHLFFTSLFPITLLMASHLVSATVSKSFKECSQFFYMQTPPAGIRGTSLKWICQKYADKLRYATLYDSSRHLPLYSAYIFKKSDGKRRMDTPWMYEPQVEPQSSTVAITCHFLKRCYMFWGMITFCLKNLIYTRTVHIPGTRIFIFFSQSYFSLHELILLQISLVLVTKDPTAQYKLLITQTCLQTHLYFKDTVWQFER